MSRFFRVSSPALPSRPLSSHPALLYPAIRQPALLYSAILGVLLVAAGCAPPSERLTLVAVDRAPLLSEPEDEGPPLCVVPAGELVKILRTVRANFAWKGAVDGKAMSREGELVEIRRAAGESTGFGFRQDLGGEVEVTTAAYLCHRMGADPACASRLHRTQIPGGVVAWEACFLGPCRVAIARGRSISTMVVDGLSELRVVTVQQQTVALATARWARPDDSGASIVVLHLGDQIKKALEIVTNRESIDHLARVIREGKLTTDDSGLHFTGQERRTSIAGDPIAGHALTENYRLAPVK